MSEMKNFVFELQEMIEENVGAPNGLSFEQIAEEMGCPVEWVHCEYEYMLEAAEAA
jgi:hypothetical protein